MRVSVLTPAGITQLGEAFWSAAACALHGCGSTLPSPGAAPGEVDDVGVAESTGLGRVDGAGVGSPPVFATGSMAGAGVGAGAGGGLVGFAAAIFLAGVGVGAGAGLVGLAAAIFLAGVGVGAGAAGAAAGAACWVLG